MEVALAFHRELTLPSAAPYLLERLAICAEHLPCNFWTVHSERIQVLIADALQKRLVPTHVHLLARKLATLPSAVDDYYSAPWFRFVQGQVEKERIEEGGQPQAGTVLLDERLRIEATSLCEPMWQSDETGRRILVPLHVNNQRSYELVIEEHGAVQLTLRRCAHAAPLPF